jgi:hypothetical protein
MRTKFDIYIFVILVFVYDKIYAALVLIIFHSGVPLIFELHKH